MLSGKVALVTGGGSGIGRAVCQVMAREGARVVAADINEVSAKETASLLSGPDHVGVFLDVTSEDSVAAVLSTMAEKYGSPATCIVNCAGIINIGTLDEMTTERFMQVIDVNLKGTFLVTKLAARAMTEVKVGGSIVNITSFAAKIGISGFSSYCASKAGVESFTRSAAKELGPKGIRCNTVLPCYIDTPMLTQVQNEDMPAMLSGVALGRIGKPEEVAEVVTFLISDRASYMTSASVEVSGGCQ